MTTFNHLVEAVNENGLDMRMYNVGDGQVGVTVMFSDDPSEVCGLSCLVTGSSGLDDAARALVPGLAATLNPELDELPPSIDGGLVGGLCSCCNQPMVWVTSGGEDAQQCPACSADDRRSERLSLSLALSMLQARLDEVAGEAAEETAMELVPMLAELDRINATISEGLAA
jgi:hypothetical protein